MSPSALEKARFEVPRQGKGYVAALNPDSGKRWRSKGAPAASACPSGGIGVRAADGFRCRVRGRFLAAKEQLPPGRGSFPSTWERGNLARRPAEHRPGCLDRYRQRVVVSDLNRVGIDPLQGLCAIGENPVREDNAENVPGDGPDH